MFVHKKFNAKDISDAIKLNGFDKVKKWLNETINKEKRLEESTKCNSE